MFFFAKSARDEKYRQEIVGPAFAEILGGGDPKQEINITSAGGSSLGGVGCTAGIWKINEKNSVNYVWNDNEGGDCRYVSFIEFDDKLSALQALCRALEIRKKILRRENLPNQNPSSKNEGLSRGTVFVWIICGVVLFGIVFWLLRKRK